VFESLLNKVVDFHDDLLRNIKGIRTAQALYDDLSGDAEDQAIAIAAEGEERIASSAPLITRPFDYGTVITYPFVPHNWHQTRFSDGVHHGVWYGSLSVETTVYESIYHWRKFLADSYANEDRLIRTDRRVFSVHCDAILIDLRGKERRNRGLVDRRSYAYTQKLGKYLYEQQQNGLLVRSARCNGINAAILKSNTLCSVKDRCYLTYLTNPTKDDVVVERRQGRTWMMVKPSRLF
jgi:hypothetical protein